MWRTFLISFALLTTVLAACDSQVQVANQSRDSGAYEVVALVAAE